MVKLEDLKVGTRLYFECCKKCNHIVGHFPHRTWNKNNHEWDDCYCREYYTVLCKVTDKLEDDWLDFQISVDLITDHPHFPEKTTVLDVKEAHYID